MRWMWGKLGLLKQQTSAVEREFLNRLGGYLVAALGLVAGLAWNDAIKAFLEYIFPLKTQSIWAKFVYAVLITLLIVVATIYVTRFLQQEEKKK